jgi:hypothetical protein
LRKVALSHDAYRSSELSGVAIQRGTLRLKKPLRDLTGAADHEFPNTAVSTVGIATNLSKNLIPYGLARLEPA